MKEVFDYGGPLFIILATLFFPQSSIIHFSLIMSGIILLVFGLLKREMDEHRK